MRACRDHNRDARRAACRRAQTARRPPRGEAPYRVGRVMSSMAIAARVRDAARTSRRGDLPGDPTPRRSSVVKRWRVAHRQLDHPPIGRHVQLDGVAGPCAPGGFTSWPAMTPSVTRSCLAALQQRRRSRRCVSKFSGIRVVILDLDAISAPRGTRPGCITPTESIDARLEQRIAGPKVGHVLSRVRSQELANARFNAPTHASSRRYTSRSPTVMYQASGDITSARQGRDSGA